MRYLLVDSANLFFRVRHTAHRGASLDDKLGLSLHILFSSVNKVVTKFNVDHVIFALEGRSWRKDFYTPYKKPRAEERQKRTESEVEEDELYWETFADMTKYLKEHTNCSVIRADNAEADDVIARWIFMHPEDKHIILSSDTDFYQLINEDVKQYNGITKELIAIDGIYEDTGAPVIDKKTQEPKVIGDPEWILFKKCIRGDKSDNVFSAYPGCREKGTKNKIGMLDAFADRNKKGFNWNNFMLQRWTDHDDVEHRVLDDYERNVHLVDLTQQPDEIVNEVEDAIENTIATDEITREPMNRLTFHFMKFCGRHDLQRLSEYPDQAMNWIKKQYPGTLEELQRNRTWKKLKQKS